MDHVPLTSTTLEHLTAPANEGTTARCFYCGAPGHSLRLGDYLATNVCGACELLLEGYDANDPWVDIGGEG